MLVTGATGQVGFELQATVPSWVELVLTDRALLDVTDAAAVRAVVSAASPDWIINAAAYTAVDRAESEPETAHAVNATGPRHLALAATEQGSRLLQVSTDYVFDGIATGPRRPDEPTAPRSVYGRTKLHGERAVLDVLGDDALIVRTAWLYSVHGSNFVKTMVRLLCERDEVRVVADQIGTPTWARGLALALWRAIALDLRGVHHWTDAGMASWYDFAVAIQEEGRALGLVPGTTRLVPVTTKEFQTAVERPAFSVLDKTATWRALGYAAEHWRVMLRGVLGELSAGNAARQERSSYSHPDGNGSSHGQD